MSSGNTPYQEQEASQMEPSKNRKRISDEMDGNSVTTPKRFQKETMPENVPSDQYRRRSLPSSTHTSRWHARQVPNSEPRRGPQQGTFAGNKNSDIAQSLALDSSGSPATPRSTKDVIYFKGEKDILSNFYPCHMSICGMEFNGAEHAYQVFKAIQHDQFELAAKIKHCQGGRDAKLLSKQIETGRFWESQKEEILTDVMCAKARTFEDFRKALIGTGKAELLHPVGDPYWGVDRFGRGLNKTGVILHQIRDDVNAAAKAGIPYSATFHSSILAQLAAGHSDSLVNYDFRDFIGNLRKEFGSLLSERDQNHELRSLLSDVNQKLSSLEENQKKMMALLSGAAARDQNLIENIPLPTEIPSPPHTSSAPVCHEKAPDTPQASGSSHQHVDESSPDTGKKSSAFKPAVKSEVRMPSGRSTPQNGEQEESSRKSATKTSLEINQMDTSDVLQLYPDSETELKVKKEEVDIRRVEVVKPVPEKKRSPPVTTIRRDRHSDKDELNKNFPKRKRSLSSSSSSDARSDKDESSKSRHFRKRRRSSSSSSSSSDSSSQHGSARKHKHDFKEKPSSDAVSLKGRPRPALGSDDDVKKSASSNSRAETGPKGKVKREQEEDEQRMRREEREKKSKKERKLKKKKHRREEKKDRRQGKKSSRD